MRFVARRVGLLAISLFAVSFAHASVMVYSANLSGAAESPPNASPGTGTAVVTVDDSANTMRVQFTFSGLLGNTTAAHIHGATAVAGTGTAGVITATPTFLGMTLGVTSDSYDNTFDLTIASSWNPAFVTAQGGSVANAEDALLAALDDGKAYLNIHTSAFPSGEIRGFLQAESVPEPSTLALLGLGLAGLAASGCRKQRRSSSAQTALT